MRRLLAESGQRKRISWISIGARLLLALLAAILLFTFAIAIWGGPISDIKAGIWWEQQDGWDKD